MEEGRAPIVPTVSTQLSNGPTITPNPRTHPCRINYPTGSPPPTTLTCRPRFFLTTPSVAEKNVPGVCQYERRRINERG